MFLVINKEKISKSNKCMMEGDMKRRGKALGMALLLIMMTVFSAVSDAAMVKADELLIKLHYHRADDNYDGWDVWMWGEGADGAAYELSLIHILR